MCACARHESKQESRLIAPLILLLDTRWQVWLTSPSLPGLFMSRGRTSVTPWVSSCVDRRANLNVFGEKTPSLVWNRTPDLTVEILKWWYFQCDDDDGDNNNNNNNNYYYYYYYYRVQSILFFLGVLSEQLQVVLVVALCSSWSTLIIYNSFVLLSHWNLILSKYIPRSTIKIPVKWTQSVMMH
jgi:hypothetical protein